MLEKILSLKEGNNSVNEFCNALRQGIPSAIFGVNEPFKSYLVSAVCDKVLFVVKDNNDLEDKMNEISDILRKAMK